MFNRRKRITLEKTPAEFKESYKPSLIFTEDMNIEKEDEYLFRFHANQLPELKQNQLSVEVLKVDRTTDPISIIALFRNTLNHVFHIEDITLLILDENNQMIGRKNLSAEDIPEFIPMSSMPCWIDIEENDLFLEGHDEIPDNIRILFNVQETLYLQENPELSRKEMNYVKQVYYSMNHAKKAGVNIMSVSVKKEDSLLTSLFLIQNGYDQPVVLQDLSLQIWNGSTMIKTVSIDYLPEVDANTVLPIKFEYDVTEWNESEGWRVVMVKA